MEPDEGNYKWGVTTSQAYFPKDNTAEFDNDLTITDWLTQYSEIKDATYVRGFLGRMLFPGEDGIKRVRVLSGGEKVRCLLSKMMISGANILILDEPTRGIDVGAKYEIYCIINQLVAEGKSVIMISSELPEILGMCDRIYVMNEGKIVGELAGSEATQELIMSKILSAGKKGALA